MSLHYPNESSEYHAARGALLQKEIELRRASEAVAALRRKLPPGGTVPEDYRFEECDVGGAVHQVSFGDLFGERDTLAIYSYMFGPERKSPCPMCTPLLDGLNGVEDHVRQRVSLVVVAESPAIRLWNFARERGWGRLRLISAAGNGYNRAYFGKTTTGDTTMLNVFHRASGEIRHFWGTDMTQSAGDPGQDHRALDAISPIFQLFDMTPEGRGTWYTKVSY